MSENLTIVTSEALQGFANITREEIAVTVQMVGFTYQKIEERAAADGKTFDEVFGIVGKETLVAAGAIEDKETRNWTTGRVRRAWTLISFMLKLPIDREVVLIDHITTRAAEELIKTQIEVKQEAQNDESLNDAGTETPVDTDAVVAPEIVH